MPQGPSARSCRDPRSQTIRDKLRKIDLEVFDFVGLYHRIDQGRSPSGGTVKAGLNSADLGSKRHILCWLEINSSSINLVPRLQ